MSSTTPRRTRQRSAVANILAATDEFRTAQEIHDLLRNRGESVGLATVYRNLQALADSGQADVVRTPDGQSAYRDCGQAFGHHHHLICRNCGHAEEIELGRVESAVDSLARQYGFTEVGHELELFGICAACSAAKA
ncbi:MAG: Fur family transcriptional regulator [Propioniciclava sp.]